MVKRKSLAHQLKWAVFNCYKPRFSQRKRKEMLKRVKKDSEEYIQLKALITSKTTKKNLLDVIYQFVNFLKKSGLYSDIKYVYDISVEWLEFLRYLRNERNYSKSSLRNYVSRIQHIEWCCKATYKRSNIDFEVEKLRAWIERLKDDEKIRSVRLTFSEYKAVIEYLMKNHSKNYQLALLLQACFGLRAYEACRVQFRDVMSFDEVLEKIEEIWKEREEKGLNPQKIYVVKSPFNLYLAVRGKGGQWRFIPALLPFQKQLLEYIQEMQRDGKNPEDWVCKCSTSSMRRELKRILVQELGFEHYKDVPSSTHMLRKTWARLNFQLMQKNKDKIDRVVISPEGIIKL